MPETHRSTAGLAYTPSILVLSIISSGSISPLNTHNSVIMLLTPDRIV